MSNNSTRDGRDGDARVYNFPRIGFRPASDPSAPAGPDLADASAPAPAGNGNGTGARARRSPLDILEALPGRELALPPLTASPSAEGGLPDTFRGEHDAPHDAGSRMGALSMAAVLAVAVAALRGTCVFLEDWRQRRMQLRAENAPLRQARLKHQLAMEQAAAAGEAAQAKHEQAMHGIGDKAAQQRAKQQTKVPSSLDFGRKAAGGGGGGGGQRSGGSKGTGVSGTTGSGSGSGGGRGGRPGPGTGGRSGSGAGSGGGLFGGGRAKDGSRGSGGRGPSGRSGGTGSANDRSGGGGKGGAKGGSAGGTRGTTNTGGSRGGGGKSPGSGRTPNRSKGPGGGTASGLDRTKPPKRTTQGAGAGLKKQRNKTDRDASRTDRTRLPEALKDAAQKSAARRLKQRRKNPDTPALWKDGDRTAPKNTPGGPKTLRNRKDTKERAKGPDLTKPQHKNGKGPANDGPSTTGPDAAKTPRRGKNDTGRNRGGKDRKSTGTRGTDRTTLWDALKKDTTAGAENRWGQRAADRGVPPLWKNDKQRTKKQQHRKTEQDKKDRPKTSPKTGPKTKPTAGPKTGTGKSQTRTGHKDHWTRMRDRARNAYDSWTAGATPQGHAPGPDAGADRDYQEPAGGPRGQDGPRRSPFEHAASTGPTTVTVDRDDYVGAQARRWEPDALTQGQAALPAAPVPHTQRPGTTRPHPAPPAPAPASARTDPRLKEARTMAHQHGTAVAHAAREMDAQHATEINLDDALDEYDVFAADGFKTHEQCLKLSERARALRDVLAAFAADLAVNHNLIGRLFTGSMARLSESMDLLARMADEMQVSSLAAAEMAETANDDLNDAYRPYTQATADGGLTTPSAPIHNQS